MRYSMNKRQKEENSLADILKLVIKENKLEKGLNQVKVKKFGVN